MRSVWVDIRGNMLRSFYAAVTTVYFSITFPEFKCDFPVDFPTGVLSSLKSCNLFPHPISIYSYPVGVFFFCADVIIRNLRMHLKGSKKRDTLFSRDPPRRENFRFFVPSERCCLNSSRLRKSLALTSNGAAHCHGGIFKYPPAHPPTHNHPQL